MNPRARVPRREAAVSSARAQPPSTAQSTPPGIPSPETEEDPFPPPGRVRTRPRSVARDQTLGGNGSRKVGRCYHPAIHPSMSFRWVPLVRPSARRLNPVIGWTRGATTGTLAPEAPKPVLRPARPFLKWAGGKRQLLPALRPLLSEAVSRVPRTLRRQRRGLLRPGQRRAVARPSGPAGRREPRSHRLLATPPRRARSPHRASGRPCTGTPRLAGPLTTSRFGIGSSIRRVNASATALACGRQPTPRSSRPCSST